MKYLLRVELASICALVNWPPNTYTSAIKSEILASKCFFKNSGISVSSEYQSDTVISYPLTFEPIAFLIKNVLEFFIVSAAQILIYFLEFKLATCYSDNSQKPEVS